MDVLPPEAVQRLASEDVPCLKCGYNLRGLEASGNCPECGSPVSRSLRGNLLEFSSADYVKRLHTGIVLILIANIVAAVHMASRVAIPMAVLGLNGNMAFADLADNVLTFLEAPIDLAALLGWWMFSSPDPAVVGSNTGDQPRRFVRVAVIIALLVTILKSLETAGGLAISNMMQFVEGPLQLLGVAVWAMKFFAAMLYLRWLAPRIPSKLIADRAGLYMWLLPVILVAGCLLFMIGYLIALVLFLLLLDYVRRSIKMVRARMDEDQPEITTS